MKEEVHRLMSEGNGHTLRVMRYRLLERVAAVIARVTKNA